MSILVGNPFFLDAGAGGAYEIERSLRFNSSDSAYLSRTPASAGNRKTWTWAGWVKRCEIFNQRIFTAGSDGNNHSLIEFTGTNNSQLEVRNYISAYKTLVTTSALFRDPSAWYHIVVSCTSSSLKIYVNGTETAYSSVTGPDGSDWFFNSTVSHTIGRSAWGSEYFGGYLADIHFIDGQALTPSSFTEVSATTGQLIPKAYTGSFGTNGFWLKFSDNSAATATTLGKDYSGNSNNWTPNNLSVTAGAGNDSLTDSPTSYGTGSSGGDVRGNFCTWNPLAKFGDITQTLNVSNGNLTFSGSSNIGTIGTIGMSSGKWYWELNCTSLTASQLYFGMTSVTTGSRTASFVGIRDTGVLSGSANGATTNGSGTTAFTTGDVVGFAYDADNKRLFVAKNNTWLNSADPAAGTNASFTDVQGSSLYPFISDNNTTATIDANWGARPFAYTAPSGFKAICDTSLPLPVVAKPSTVMDVKLYTGNGTSQTISGLGFSPDFVWLKSRGAAYNHQLFDTIRGTGKQLFSNLTSAETTESFSWLNAFNSNGFGVTGAAGVNDTNDPMVAWCFDAGSSTSTNTAGSITGGAQVRANPSAGFSIITFTMGSGSYTVGHGLNTAPSLLITKARSNTSSWWTYHASLGTGSYLALNSTAAAASDYSWGSAPTSTVFTANNDFFTNGYTYVVYAFSPVAGYSSFGSYTGNGSTDGPFVYTGHRSRWLLIKNSSASENWRLHDTARSPYNVMQNLLFPNLSNAETTSSEYNVDILSNGFKIRANTAGSLNDNGSVYVWASFAENPFQYARAR